MTTATHTTALFGLPTHIAAEEAAWNARWHRKQRSPDHAAPHSVSWWIAVFFGVGAVFFIIGTCADFASSDALATWTDFIGACLFGVGAILSIIEAYQASRRIRPFVPHRNLWHTAAGRASIIQGFCALVLFQLAMTVPLWGSLGWQATDVWIWAPSTLGSVGFVVASGIYYREAKPAKDIGTTAALVNLVGSWCYLIGSAFGFLEQGPVQMSGDWVVNPVFLVGSVLFFFGGVFSIMELRQPLQQHQTALFPQ
ncbi:hypothetical protein KRX51_07390 [Corynebacterium sp. TAE3-ERU12]|uniref:hypothetical protein n=1 Tax=Corynebacterium sp. TAE3-ERU12 TaxID=2849491 RepID=UPI001C489EE7|nr:hypothetical protein [Corynebacterium sp. TAE3-ERU12]MBV7295736.1 hypothetical protein [Corynebacterium sp. TAE3-ERU12]